LEACVWSSPHWNVSTIDHVTTRVLVAKYEDEYDRTEQLALGVLPDLTYMKAFAELPKKKTRWNPIRAAIDLTRLIASQPMVVELEDAYTPL
jgi:hypothetical protein